MSTSLLLAHGSGAGHQSSLFLQTLTDAFECDGLCQVAPVTFQYMEKQESEGKKSPPSKFDRLVEEYLEQIPDDKTVVLAGKSLGGRVATQLSSHQSVKAIVCFGFPFHPPGKPERHRLSFLSDLQVPCLIIQGTRDAFGKPEWLNQHVLPKNVSVHWIEGADHSFNTLKKQNISLEQTCAQLVSVVRLWLSDLELA